MISLHDVLDCTFPCYGKLIRRSMHFPSLREKCPNTELFLLRIFLHSVQIQKNTDQKQLRIWTLFTQYMMAFAIFSCDIKGQQLKFAYIKLFIIIAFISGFHISHSAKLRSEDILSRPYLLKLLKGCLPQNILSPLLNTVPSIILV